jgi:hypothetical protein
MSLLVVIARHRFQSLVGNPLKQMASLLVRFLPSSSAMLFCEFSLTSLAGGILACPEVSSSQNGSTTYQIYVNTPAFNQTNCTTLEGLLPHYTSAGVYGAWEYI